MGRRCRPLARRWQVLGARVEAHDGPLEIRAPLTVGRRRATLHSRALAGLTRRDIGAPIDVAWFE